MSLQVEDSLADVCAYDLSGGSGCPSVEVKQLVEGLLVGAHVGGHAAGLGSAAGGGVDQHGFLDPAEGVQEGLDGQVVAGAAGLQAQQVGQLQGQLARRAGLGGGGTARTVVLSIVIGAIIVGLKLAVPGSGSG